MSQTTDARQHAASARAARARRIHALRTRVGAVSVAIFCAAWAGIFFQLVSGHDPALASGSVPAATQPAVQAPSDRSVSSGAWPAPDPAPAADPVDGGSVGSGSEPSPVQTGQS